MCGGGPEASPLAAFRWSSLGDHGRPWSTERAPLSRFLFEGASGPCRVAAFGLLRKHCVFFCVFFLQLLLFLHMYPTPAQPTCCGRPRGLRPGPFVFGRLPRKNGREALTRPPAPQQQQQQQPQQQQLGGRKAFSGLRKPLATRLSPGKRLRLCFPRQEACQSFPPPVS